MILASDIVDRARVLLKDVAPFRWPDEELLVHVDDGQVEIERRRPDALYSVAVTTDEPGRVTNLTDELRLDRQYITCLTDWVMHRALLKDAEEADLTRSEVHLKLFLRGLA